MMLLGEVLLDVEVIRYCTYVLFAIAIFMMLFQGDEFPLIVVLFYYSSGLARWDVIQAGKVEYVQVAYSRSIFEMTDELAFRSLNYFFYGTSILLISYVISILNAPQPIPFKENKVLLKSFILKNQIFIINFFLVILGFNVVFDYILGELFRSGTAYAFGMSYLIYFGFALSGMMILMFLAYQSIDVKRNAMSKALFMSLMVLAAFTSFKSSARFTFLAWVFPIGMLVVRNMPNWRKLLIYSVGGSVLIVAFAIVGVWRVAIMYGYKTIEDMWEPAMHRIEVAEDNNMLDGLMMLIQVYPKHLDHTYGMEHLEILARPIPRAWWPGKPVGGYHNKLGLNENMGGYTVGISPTIYGTFYAEASIYGIFIFSILYGIIFSSLFKYVRRFNSEWKYFFKGMIIACAVPVLRGGDLPGIIAFICMAYWPIILAMSLYNSFVKKHYARQRAIEQELEHMNKVAARKKSVVKENVNFLKDREAFTND